MYKTQGQDSCYLIYGSNTSSYEIFLYRDQPDLIIGMGDYTGADQEKLRIESYCTNSCSNEIVHGGPEIQLSLYVPTKAPLGFKKGAGMSNGCCNNVCHKLLKWIESEKPNTKLLFIHIPKSYNWGNAVKSISQLIYAIQQGLTT